eukprot:TRINITY_DN207_c0_g1_i14.p1 TRINITY_DN207_c0_g1~~TRINITY_DN207_c0_g1_i14.p1  ORF type:complete len:563 (+),score=126.84 TRINITY_DN207_c0_g1_i14:182-1870(+)
MIGGFFKFEERQTNIYKEILGGTVTFLTMSYILAVNAGILTDSGGTCSQSDCTVAPDDPACIFFDPGYESCLDDLKKDLITATALSAMVACFIMGFGANLPLGLAPGMGLNAYFTYNVVGFRGTGSVAYTTALAAIFLEGIVFVILAITGARAKFVTYFPKSIMQATAVGIGLFLCHIGLQGAEGLGIVTYEPATLVTLGGCRVDDRAPMYIIGDPTSVCDFGSNSTNLPPSSPNYACVGDKMVNPALWLGLSGLAIMAILMVRGVKGAVMIGIIFVTVIAWIPGHGASYLGADSAIPGGEARRDEFEKVVAAPSLDKTGGEVFDGFKGIDTGDFWVAFATFLYVDFLDTTGTLFSMATYLTNYIPDFMDSRGNFPGSTVAFMTDGIATIVGSLCGTSPVTTYIESAAGIREGARTGLAAVVTGFWFFVSLFFNPLLSNVPPYATGPALIIVGALMSANVVRIRWDRLGDAIPAFLTLAIMPLTYSIAYGIIAGLGSWIVLNGADFIIEVVLGFIRTGKLEFPKKFDDWNTVPEDPYQVKQQEQVETSKEAEMASVATKDID